MGLHVHEGALRSWWGSTFMVFCIRPMPFPQLDAPGILMWSQTHCSFKDLVDKSSSFRVSVGSLNCVFSLRMERLWSWMSSVVIAWSAPVPVTWSWRIWTRLTPSSGWSRDRSPGPFLRLVVLLPWRSTVMDPSWLLSLKRHVKYISTNTNHIFHTRIWCFCSILRVDWQKTWWKLEVKVVFIECVPMFSLPTYRWKRRKTTVVFMCGTRSATRRCFLTVLWGEFTGTPPTYSGKFVVKTSLGLKNIKFLLSLFGVCFFRQFVSGTPLRLAWEANDSRLLCVQISTTVRAPRSRFSADVILLLFRADSYLSIIINKFINYAIKNYY